jgi:sugar phosphate isomerase/epimerase
MDLGVVVTIETPNQAEAVFRRAVAAGFTFGQVNLACHPLTVFDIRDVAVAARKFSFKIVAVGCTANLLRLAENSLMGGDEADLVTLAQNMAMLDDCKKLVLWSGTHSRRWMDPNLLNLGEDAYFAMVFELHRLLGRLGNLPITVLLQPCYAHILHDVATTLRLSEDFPDDRVCIALDIAYLIAPTVYAKHPQVLPQMVSALAPMADIITFSDIILEDGRLSHPLPGHGTLNFPALLNALASNVRPGIPHLLQTAPTHRVTDLEAAREYLTEITISE